MQLLPDQLSSHLSQTPLHSIWLISGDEPLQMLECCDQIRIACRDAGVTERTVLEVDRSFNWQSLQEENRSLSLFSAGKLIELRLGNCKPGREGSTAITEYLKNGSMNNVLLISSQRLDKSAQSAQWYKAIAQQGTTINCWPIKDHQLPEWIQNRCRHAGKTIEPEAAMFLAEKVEGNLLAAKQEIDKLQLIVDDDKIDLQDIFDLIVDNSRYDIFAVLDAAYHGNLNRVQKMLQGLRSEGKEPIEIYPAIMWEFRRLCMIAYRLSHGDSWVNLMKEYRIFDPKKKLALKQSCEKHPPQRLQQMLAGAIRIERTIKSKNKDLSWNELLNFLAYLAGFNLKLKNHTAITL